MMAAVPRKPQKPLTLANARGVLCSSSVGKLYARCLRTAAVPGLVAETLGAQFGAVPGGGTDLPAVAVQLFMDGAARRGKTVAVLFGDIKGAFYNILPEVALGPLMTDSQRTELFGQLGMSERAAAALSDSIKGGLNALARHGLEDGWRAALADWHRGSWFMVRGSDRCTVPLVGVRPGDPPADVVFAIAFAAVMKLLGEELDARGLQPMVEVCGDGIFRTPGAPGVATVIPEMTYMDDVALLLEASDAQDIFEKLESAADALVRVATAFGLKVNFAAGKTEAIVGLHGRGSAAARQHLASLEVHQDGGDQVPVLPVPGTAGLRIVSAYKHLGRHVAGSGRMNKEITYRCRSASSASAALMRRVFAARGIPVTDRGHVAQACVTSRLLHGAGTWLTLSNAQLRKVRGQYTRPLRRIAGHDVPPEEGQRWPTAIQTLVATKQAPVEAHIAAARLRLAARISSKGTAAVRGMVQSRSGANWRRALIRDLGLMRVVLRGKLRELPEPAAAPAAWEAFWRQYPGAWAALIRKFMKTAAADPAAFLAALEGLHQAGEAAGSGEVEGEEVVPPAAADVPMPPAAAEEPAPQCEECGKVFASLRALKCHGTHAHGRKRPAAAFVVSAICPACGNDYRTRLRALEHVERGSARCRLAVLEGGMVPHSPEVIAAADAVDREVRRHARAQGVSVYAGPPAILRRPPEHR